MPTARLAPMSRLTRRVSYCAGGLHANPPGAVASTHSGWRAMLQSVCPATAPPNSVSTKLGWEPVWAATDWGGGRRRAGPAAARTRVGASVLEETEAVYRQPTGHHEGNARGSGPRAARVVHDADLQPDQPPPH